MSFNQLGLDNWLLKNIACLEYSQPTIVQQSVIPKILKRQNVLAIAKTGTGKTASFCLPILSLLSKDPFGLFAVILEPTHELAIQVLEKLQIYSTGFNIRISLIIGGVDFTEQVIDLDKIPHVIIATPGRFVTFMESKSIKLIENVNFFVLDEFDQLLNDTIKPDVLKIARCLPSNRSTLFFSATMSMGIEELDPYYTKEAKGGLTIFDISQEEKEAEVALISKTNKELIQKYILLPQKMKENYLVHLLGSVFKWKTTMVFVSTFKQCHILYTLFKLFEMKVSAIHSKMPQKERINNLNKFKSSVSNILIATDIASRGLDIPICDLVINYDLPRNPDDYVHRVGRTARAEHEGMCLSFVAQYDIELLLAIEQHVNVSIEEMTVNEDEIMGELSLVSQGVKLAQMKLYESGFDTKIEQIKQKAQTRKEANEKLTKNKKKING